MKIAGDGGVYASRPSVVGFASVAFKLSTDD